MLNFDVEFFNIGYLDSLSYRKSFIHQIHPAAKLLVTLVFIISVVSFPKYEIGRMLPYAMFPLFIIIAGDIPYKVILKKLVVLSPFVLFIGIFNPLLDRAPLYEISGVTISGGWVSYFSIIVRFVLTISAALLLIATTSFPGICYGLERFRMPRIFVVQLLFLYRYIFVLTEETMRIVRARNIRVFGKKGRDVRTFISITGVLLARSMERSERVYQSICSRGFEGQIRLMKDFRLCLSDVMFIVITTGLFAAFRAYDMTNILGGLLTGTR